MKYSRLIWSGIWRRPKRAALAMLSIISAFCLFGLLNGLAEALHSRTLGAGADQLITMSRASMLEPLPIAVGNSIRTVSGVSEVSPLIIMHGSYRSSRPINIAAYAVDASTLDAVSPQSGMTTDQLATLAQNRTGALVPRSLATSWSWKVGDIVPLRSVLWSGRDGSRVWPVKIVGIFTPTRTSPVFANSIIMNYEYVDQGRSAYNGTANLFFARIDNAESAASIAKSIDAMTANSLNPTRTGSQQQIAQEAIRNIGDVVLVARTVTIAVLFALLLSVAVVMMQAVRERNSELAVLRTLGFSTPLVFGLLLAEALIFCVGSAAIGLLCATGLFPFAKLILGLEIQSGLVVTAGLTLAICLAVIAILPPALRAVRGSIVDALAA